MDCLRGSRCVPPGEHLIVRQGSRRLSAQQRKFATPKSAYRSGLEELAAKHIAAAGLTVLFEKLKLRYVVPQSDHVYTPDFELPGGIIIETKGLLTREDRKKMLLVKAQHPGLDIRMVFSNANARIAPKSPTTYAKWAETYGFPWAHKTIPTQWLQEALSYGT
jgi:hypothetical protein